MSRKSFRRRSERGSVLVELGVAVPVLMSLVLGMITGGQSYFRKIGVTEAVREGGRYGASLLLGTGGTALTDWETAVKQRIVDSSGGQLTLADVCAKLVLPTGATDCGVNDPTSASTESTIHLVKVSATTSVQIQWFFFTTTSTLNPKLAFRYERDTG